MSVFGELAALRERPIGDQGPMRALAAGHRGHRLDLSDPRSVEPLIDLATLGIAGRNHYAHDRNPPYFQAIPGAVDQLLVRRGVAERLVRVNAALAACRLELFVFDAWRPTAVQAFFFETWVPAELARRRPDLAAAALTAEVRRFWSPPTVDLASPAPHSTGGAVDLTIRWKDTGEPLWMGSIFDDASDIALTDHFERPVAGEISFSNDEARANRRLLHWLMVDQGFAAHPNEWWHFGYGELIWARLTGAPAGFYGFIGEV